MRESRTHVQQRLPSLYPGALLKSTDGEWQMILGQWMKKIRLFYSAAANLLERSRVGAALIAGMRATGQHFGRVLHQLWLEVTGLVFLVIATIGVVAGMREYAKYQSNHAIGPGRLALAICFTLTFAWFGLSSFWRVKRKIKS